MWCSVDAAKCRRSSRVSHPNSKFLCYTEQLETWELLPTPAQFDARRCYQPMTSEAAAKNEDPFCVIIPHPDDTFQGFLYKKWKLASHPCARSKGIPTLPKIGKCPNRQIFGALHNVTLVISWSKLEDREIGLGVHSREHTPIFMVNLLLLNRIAQVYYNYKF